MNFIPLINEGGGAGLQDHSVHAGTLSDIEARISDRAKAGVR